MPVAAALATLACLIAPASGAAAVTVSSASPALNGLRISGNRFVDDAGNPITLRGVYYTSFDWSCVNGGLLVGAPVSVSAIQALLAWHINAVRIGVAEDCWLGINGAPSGGTATQYQQQLMSFVNLLHSYGIYTELGLIYAAPGTNISNSQIPMPDADHSVAFWSSFASYFKNEPDTIFGLYGEPHPDATSTASPWACWRDGGSSCNVTYNGHVYTAAGMQQLVDAIRATGSTSPITVSAIHWAEDFSQWLAYEPSDPLHQLAAEWHQYGDIPCFNSSEVMKANNASCWNTADLQVINQVPMIDGEAGEYAHSNTCAWQFLPTYLPWAEAHHVSYELWRWGPTNQCDNMALNEDYSGTPSPLYGQGYEAWLTAIAEGSAGTATTAGGGMAARQCDWQVAFAPAAQSAMVGASIPYRLTVTNVGSDAGAAGSATCPATKLDVWPNRATTAGSNTKLTLDSSGQGQAQPCQPPGTGHRQPSCLVLSVASLPAGTSASFGLHASQGWRFSAKKLGSATIRAELSSTSAGAGNATASVTTRRVLAGITRRTATVSTSGGVKMPFACNRPAANSCRVSGIVEAPSTNPGRAFLSNAARLPGRARGLIHGGRKGRIAIKLSHAGRRLIRPHHQLRVLLVLTVSDGSGEVSTLAYPVTLRAG